MRRLGLIIVGSALAFAGSACRTTDHDAVSKTVSTDATQPAMPAVPTVPPPPPPPPQAVECPVPDSVCSTELNPVACSALMYEGHTIPEDAAVAAWGSNVCQGRLNLAREACKREMRPTQLGRVQCVPDASNGHCPAPEVICTVVYEPTTCEAKTYGDQELKSSQILSATGTNSCEAHARLDELACRRNLDPKLLTKIDCSADRTNGECPVRTDACNEAPRPTRCQAALGDGRMLEKPLEGRGQTLCEAKQVLARQACKLGIRPSTLDNVTCQAEK